MHLSTNFGKEIREKKSPATNGLSERPENPKSDKRHATTNLISNKPHT